MYEKFAETSKEIDKKIAKVREVMTGAVKENMQKLNLLAKELEVTKVDIADRTS